MSVQQALFGGAITLTLPGPFLDASTIRQVPDHQEVLLAHDSDVSAIVEVLQEAAKGVSPADLGAAVRFHFGSIAHDNEALSSEVIWDEPPASSDACAPGATPAPALLYGTQRIRKFGKATEESTVNIFVAVWRLESKKIDLVLSVNDPRAGAPDATADWFRSAAQSLQIRDWGLFA
ncbi:hypothetical protein MSPP1_003972 [Malassezia sp. CBS 17886]|nr:hypothetical protein MSPP1_003972 [Malassezia sp. CBS 17886]